MAGKSSSASKQVTLDEYNPECTHCPKLCGGTMHVCMEGDGPDDAEIMIVGEAPGQTEDDFNRPFIGQAGDYLREDLLRPSGLREEEIRFTNANRCHPPRNRDPSIREIHNCRPYLEAEIKRVNPKVIIGTGNVPLAALLKFFYKDIETEGIAKKTEGRVSGILTWQGKPIWLQEFNCWFIPTAHPSYAMRNQRKHSLYSTNCIIDHFKLAAYYSTKPRTTYRVPTSVHLTEPKLVIAMLETMRKAKVFAFDIETGGSGRTIDKYIIGCSFACGGEIGYYVEWPLLKSPEVYRVFKRLMTDETVTRIMHNGAYELRMFKFHGFPLSEKYYDTMIAAHFLDENFFKGLKQLAWVHTKFGGYDIPLEEYKSQHRIKEDYSKIPVEILAPYAALDAVATYILWTIFEPRLKQESLWASYSQIMMPVRRVMTNAEYTGIAVDLGRAEALRDACEAAMKKLDGTIYKMVGEKFNINSNAQLAEMLYSKLHLTPMRETKTGWSVDADSIVFIAQEKAGTHIASCLLDRAYIKTMMSTHISQAIGFRWPEDGRIHASYNLTAAVTGRTGCAQPSLQNVPRDALVRSLYAASEGNLIVEADLKSAELMYLAAESGDPTFIRAFAEGLDLHEETARLIFNIPANQPVTKIQRRIAKMINFGLVYGMSAMRLASELKIAIEEAETFMSDYFDKMPGVREYMDRQKKIVKAQGYVQSLFRFKRRLPYALSDNYADIARAERQAMNAPIQNGAAFYTYVGLVRLAREIKYRTLQGRIVHTVHDCALTDTPIPEVPKMSEAIRVAFETPLKIIPIQMRVDVEAHKRWGENNESRLQEILDSVRVKLAA